MCGNLGSVEIPNAVTNIGYCAFAYTSLTSVIIPDNVTFIGWDGFGWINTLTTVTIGSGVSSIGSEAFAHCPNLKDVYTYSDLVPNANVNTFQDSYIEYATLHVPYNTYSIYASTSPWDGFGTIVEMPRTKFTLLYILDGVDYLSFEIEKGDAITPEPEPTKEGYTFSGWSEIPETMPDNDVTITGTFSVNKHHLIYIVDGEEYSNTLVDYGTTIIALGEPSQEGYAFSGWSEIPEVMPDYDVTVSGSFRIMKYELNIMIENGEWGTVLYGDETIAGAGQTFNVNHGSDVTIFISPGAGKSLKWVKVDGENLKSRLENGTLTINNVTNTMQVAVRFVETFSLTLASETATYCPSQDIDFSDLEGLKAYVGSQFDSNTNVLTLRRVYDVKAGTGLVLIGTPGTYHVMIDEATSVYTNLLTGVTSNTMLYPTNDNYINYILSNGIHGVGFYPVRRVGYLNAGKAYLSLPLFGGAARSVIVFDENNMATGITGTMVNEETESNIYNLQGQRTKRPTKAGVYIKNGDKIIIKK